MNLFQGKFARWQSIVPCARSMGALMRCIIRPTVASMTRTVNSRRDSARASMVAQPLIKNVAQLSAKVEKLEKANKKLKKSSKKCKCEYDSDSSDSDSS